MDAVAGTIGMSCAAVGGSVPPVETSPSGTVPTGTGVAAVPCRSRAPCDPAGG